MPERADTIYVDPLRRDPRLFFCRCGRCYGFHNGTGDHGPVPYVFLGPVRGNK